MIKILIVDDEINIRNAIIEYGSILGYTVEGANDGLSALSLINRNHYDLVILDLMMPNLDGFKTCEKIKEIKDIPIIFLSAKTTEDDKLLSFKLGADDYVTKPFSIKELMARVKAVLERKDLTLFERFTYRDLVVNFAACVVTINDQRVNLTPKEYDLLVYFIKNKNIALSREKLLTTIWGYYYEGDDRTVDTHIKMLRNNLKEYRDLIVTVRLLGYKFEI